MIPNKNKLEKRKANKKTSQCNIKKGKLNNIKKIPFQRETSYLTPFLDIESERENKNILAIKVRLHTAINRADFVSW